MLTRLGRILARQHRLAPSVTTRSFGNSRAAFGGHAAHDSHGHDDHGHGHGHHDEPHVPEFYDKLGKGCLIVAYLWIFYRIKEDKGQLFGLYKPWLDEHHHEHFKYKAEEIGSMPVVVTHHDHAEGEEEDEE